MVIKLDFTKKPDESFKLVEGKKFSILCTFEREPEKKPKVVCFIKESPEKEEYMFTRSDLFIKPKDFLHITPHGFDMLRVRIRRGPLNDPLIEEVG